MYGVVGLCIVGMAIAAQVALVKLAGKASWLSKDVAMAACGLGPVLQAHRDAFGHTVQAGALHPKQLQATVYMFEALFQALPMLVVKSILLVGASADSGVSPMLLISIAISILSIATLALEAERLFNRLPPLRRICAPLPYKPRTALRVC